ncbi:MAG: Uma2 family endonuclease [Arcicella sp.]|jgi:Uma2 family endonuclease|nr:Uma2 family endonuclease [Arcicella sp.]
MANSLTNIDLNGRYTYADYLKWSLEEYVELIKGKIFRMSPAPLSQHQILVHRLDVELGYYLKKKTCQVFPAPFDVRLVNNGLFSDEQITTVVQPDLCIVCDPSKIDRRGCLGSPDMIIEILSSSTAKKDLDEKYHLYEESGVKEYWVVFPDEKIISVYLLNQEKAEYELLKHFEKGEKVKVNVLEDLVIDLDDIFD